MFCTKYRQRPKNEGVTGVPGSFSMWGFQAGQLFVRTNKAACISYKTGFRTD
jgi:hypothetical protein